MFAATLSACAVGPDYVKPDVPAAIAYAGSTTLAARTGESPAPALDTWWQGFGDAELTSFVEAFDDFLASHQAVLPKRMH